MNATTGGPASLPLGIRPIAPLLTRIGRMFAAEGFEIALVGGPVRDALLQRPCSDLDFTTNARPDDIERILTPWADTTWDVGRAFGTIGARHGRWTIEVTTYRADSYDPATRHPTVSFGTDLVEDLVRRDFAVNAMALRLPDFELVDPHGGVLDLSQRLLRTPTEPQVSFSDDPLRMLRACRFAAQLDFEIDPDTFAAMREMAGRLEIISAERIRDELTKLIMSDLPRKGLLLLVESGLAAQVMPELPALQLERDEHHRHKDVYEHTLTVLTQSVALESRLGGPDLVSRLAALFHDVGKPRTRRFESDGTVSFHHHDAIGARMTRKRLTALRFPKDVVADVSTLVELHLRFHGYGTGLWTDSAVRRYVRDAGPLLSRLHILTRADCTTRNRRRAAALAAAYDSLEARIERLEHEEELARLRPALDGNEIMTVLGIGPGPVVGRAYRFLMDVRLDRGEVPVEAAVELLRQWARDEGVLDV